MALSSVQSWLYDYLPLGVAILDRDLNYRYVNATYAATQGLAPPQLIDRPLQTGTPAWTAQFTALITQARETRHAAALYEVPLVYPRQPALTRTWDITLLPLFEEEVFTGAVLYLLDVTDRRQAREARASEALFRSVLEVAADAILVIDANGIILQTNPATGRIFGYQLAEMIGQPVEMLMVPEDGTMHPLFLARYLHTGVPHIIGTIREVRARRKDGTVFPCELSVAESQAHPQSRIYVGILRDISERRQAEEALRRVTQQYESILNAAGEGIFGLDTQGRVTFANPATLAILGFEAQELCGQPSHAQFHHTRKNGQPYPVESCPIYATYSDGQVHRADDDVFWRKDGTSFPVEYISTPIYEGGRLVGAVVSFTDITERQRLQTEIEAVNARLTAILQTVPLPLIAIDAEGHPLLANREAEALYGEALTRGTFFSMTRLYPGNRAPWPVEEWPILRALREGVVVRDVEQILVLPNETEIPLLVHAAPVIVEGHTIAAVGVVQDLTQLQAANRAKDAFLALITHELKSPLTAIISWADLAQDDASLCGDALDVILRSAHQQRRIIDDLLDISRILYGKLILRKEPVDAWEIARAAAEGLRPTCEARGLTLTLSPPDRPLPVEADPVRLSQVFNNLLTNAIKFTPAGGAITVAGAREDAQARVRVHDTGQGIPPTQLPFIFERFQQLGREYVSGGLGLGLAVVNNLVTLHEGHVEAQSPGIGKGSTFTVYLPLRSP